MPQIAESGVLSHLRSQIFHHKVKGGIAMEHVALKRRPSIGSAIFTQRAMIAVVVIARERAIGIEKGVLPRMVMTKGRVRGKRTNKRTRGRVLMMITWAGNLHFLHLIHKSRGSLKRLPCSLMCNFILGNLRMIPWEFVTVTEVLRKVPV